MVKKPIVISASRMTDMPAFYPEAIISEIEMRKSKGFTIHTIVLWTKHIRSIFKEPLFSYLKEQQKSGTQLYFQLTVTGMGSDVVIGYHQRKVFPEPCVPNMKASLAHVDDLIEFARNPHRIRLRVDPLIRVRDSQGNLYENYDKLPEIIELLAPKAIKNFTFSFLEKDIYKKVDNRFSRQGIEIISPDISERKLFAENMNTLADNLKVSITSCSVPGLPTSACINGQLLMNLHDQHWPLDLSQPHSRELCGCTKSVDIGGWPPKVCNSGCMYCYARPKIL